MIVKSWVIIELEMNYLAFNRSVIISKTCIHIIYILKYEHGFERAKKK